MIYLILIVSTLLAPFQPEKASLKDGIYELDISASKIAWTGSSALGTNSHNGTIPLENGKLFIDNGNLVSVNVAAKVSELESDSEDLTEHLKSADFFETDKFPDAAFSLENAIAAEEGTSTVTGRVTIKGTHGEETFEVSLEKSKSSIICTFEITLDRTKYGVNYGSPSLFKGLKDKAISDEFEVKGALVFTR